MNKTSYTRKIIITGVALLLLSASTFGLLDHQGENYVNTGLTRAMVVYGISRGMNGIISVAQGTELSLQPVGVGLNLAPGQILDPVNDLIERFSTVMLFSASSLGVQKLVLEVVSSVAFMVLAIIILLLLIANEWSHHKFLPTWFNRALLIFLVVRLSVPVMAIASEGFYHLFLKDSYENSIRKLESASKDIEKLSEREEVTAESDPSLLGQAKELFKSTTENINLRKRFEEYKYAAARISTQVVDMIVIFVVQTVLFPVLFLWLIIKFSGKLLSGPNRQAIRN